MAEAAVPGCRVRVRFAGQLTGGLLLDRVAASEHPGRLAALERVVSPERVLTPEIAALAREGADRYAGTGAGVLRLATPPRRAGAEARPGGPGTRGTPRSRDGAGTLGSPGTRGAPGPAAPRPARPVAGPWTRYPAGRAFLAAVAAGRAPRAVWAAQ